MSSNENLESRRFRLSDLLLLFVAILISTVIYFPISTFVQSSRTKQLQGVLDILKKRDKPGYEALLVARPGLVEPNLGADGVGEVEAAARSIKQFLAERYRPKGIGKKIEKVKEAKKESHKGSATEQSISKKDLTQIRSVLATAFMSRFFGTEQFACYILSIWACLMITYRWSGIRREQKLISIPVFPDLPGGTVFTPDRSAWLLEQIHTSLAGSYVGRTVQRSLMRFQTARDVAAAEAVVQTESDGIYNELDSSLAMVRFVIWAVPSIGFIGTVRGMGMALSRADSPDALTEVVGWLGVAFDSTLIALFLSVILMMLSYRYQGAFETFVQKLDRKCADELIHQMYVPTESKKSFP